MPVPVSSSHSAASRPVPATVGAATADADLQRRARSGGICRQAIAPDRCLCCPARCTAIQAARLYAEATRLDMSGILIDSSQDIQTAYTTAELFQLRQQARDCIVAQNRQDRLQQLEDGEFPHRASAGGIGRGGRSA